MINKKRIFRFALMGMLCLGLVAVGGTQIKEVIKIVGVGAAVKQFGKDINRAVNKLTGHKDSDKSYTKVVPIITWGVGSKSAIGAAQIMGSKSQVEKVEAVASPEVDLFGREIRIRAMVPIDSISATSLKAVDGVGISGIVDLKL